jgi:CBS-domain-containing membrane protein
MRPARKKVDTSMELKSVKELMVPLDRYAVVTENATLLDAILTIDEAQKQLDPNVHPHRAVLVKDDSGRIVGKIGQIAFLRALQPHRNMLDDTGKLASAGVSEQVISTVIDHAKFFQDNLSDLCARASGMSVTEAMRPVSESIDENCSLAEAIARMVQWESLSVLVKRKNEVVGLLRLSDVYQEIAEYIKGISNS